MFWDDLVRHWRRANKGNSPTLLRAAGGHVAVMPAPRRSRPIRYLVLALAILGGLLLLVASGRLPVS
jgi:hypothetical protein